MFYWFKTEKNSINENNDSPKRRVITAEGAKVNTILFNVIDVLI